MTGSTTSLEEDATSLQGRGGGEEVPVGVKRARSTLEVEDDKDGEGDGGPDKPGKSKKGGYSGKTRAVWSLRGDNQRGRKVCPAGEESQMQGKTRREAAEGDLQSPKCGVLEGAKYHASLLVGADGDTSTSAK